MYWTSVVAILFLHLKLSKCLEEIAKILRLEDINQEALVAVENLRLNNLFPSLDPKAENG